MPIMPGVIWRGDKSAKRRMDRYDVFTPRGANACG